MIIKFIILKMKVAVVLAGMLAITARGQQGQCPSMECLEKPREDLLCFKHSGTHPVDKVTFWPCPRDYICDIDYTQQYKVFPLRN